MDAICEKHANWVGIASCSQCTIESLRQQLADMKSMSVCVACSEISAVGEYVAQLEQQLAAALAACEAKDAALSAIIGATKSHVDGRDLLAELHPRHYMDIKVRRNGKDIWFEADWLSNLQRAITSHKAALAIKPDASALRQHDEALIERCAKLAEKEDSYILASAIRELKGQL